MVPSAQSQELVQLIRVAWILLIPAGVLLSLVLYKLFVLLHGVVEFLTLARHELTPAMRDLRLTAEHVETLSAKAVANVKTVEDTAASVGPAMRSLRDKALAGAGAIWRVLRQSFRGI
ncbi:MAG TPA: hypothetical protein V6C99_09405 [Oculatellaceae cyanobacterium]|jgi:hypothetical protein